MEINPASLVSQIKILVIEEVKNMKPIDYVRLAAQPLCPHCLFGFMDEQLNNRVTCGKANLTFIVALPCTLKDWKKCPLNKEEK